MDSINRINLTNIKKEVADIATNYHQISTNYNRLLKIQDEKDKQIKQLMLEKQLLDDMLSKQEQVITNTSNEKNINDAIAKLTAVTMHEKDRINSSIKGNDSSKCYKKEKDVGNNEMKVNKKKQELKVKNEELIKLKIVYYYIY